MISWNLYTKHDVKGDDIVKKKLGKMYTWMTNKFYVDEFYESVIIKPFVYVGKNIIMGIEKYLIDGVVHGIGNGIMLLGDLFKRLQTGLVSNYAYLVVVGMVAILSYLLMA